MIKYSIKHCELSSVVITIHGSCLLGGCIYSLDCLISVIPVLVFLVLVRGYTQIPMLMFIVCGYTRIPVLVFPVAGTRIPMLVFLVCGYPLPYVGVSCMRVYPHTRNANIGITPIGQSKLFMQPPSKRLPRIVIITLYSLQHFIENILSSTVNILIYWFCWS
jgi:hypothetical protein